MQIELSTLISALVGAGAGFVPTYVLLRERLTSVEKEAEHLRELVEKMEHAQDSQAISINELREVLNENTATLRGIQQLISILTKGGKYVQN